MHTFDGKEFWFKAPVLKKEEKEGDNSASNVLNSSCSKNMVEIHGDITSLSMDILELYLENKTRSGGGEITELNLDANPSYVIFCDSEGAYCSA